MNIRKKIIVLGSFISIIGPIGATISCGNKGWEGHEVPTKDSKQFEDFHLEVKPQAILSAKDKEDLKKESEIVAKLLTKEWNDTHPKNKRAIKFSVVTQENTSTIAQRLDSGAIAGAMLTPSFFGEYAESRKSNDSIAKARKYGIFPALVTSRFPLTIGLENKEGKRTYTKDNENADINLITKYFNDHYLSQSKTRYNGLVIKDTTDSKTGLTDYSSLYYPNASSSDMTPYYRGVIIMAGDDNARKEIKKAWDEKNWIDFKKHKLIFQKNTSISGYQYPQQFLKEHFTNNGKTPFKSLKQEAAEDSAHVNIGTSGMLARIGTGAGKIGFTYLKDLVKNNKLYFPNEGEKLRIVTVTKPLLTDGIGLSGILSKEERKVFIKVFKKLIRNEYKLSDIGDNSENKNKVLNTNSYVLWKIYGAKDWVEKFDGKTFQKAAIEFSDGLFKAGK